MIYIYSVKYIPIWVHRIIHKYFIIKILKTGKTITGFCFYVGINGIYVIVLYIPILSLVFYVFSMHYYSSSLRWNEYNESSEPS